MTFGTGHIVLILILLVVVLIIWGPGKLPDVGAGLGRAIREFKKASSETTDAVRYAVKNEPESGPSAPPAAPATPPASGSASSSGASSEEHTVSS